MHILKRTPLNTGVIARYLTLLTVKKEEGLKEQNREGLMKRSELLAKNKREAGAEDEIIK